MRKSENLKTCKFFLSLVRALVIPARMVLCSVAEHGDTGDICKQILRSWFVCLSFISFCWEQWQHELVLFKVGTDVICTAIIIANIISTFREKGREISKAWKCLYRSSWYISVFNGWQRFQANRCNRNSFNRIN